MSNNKKIDRCERLVQGLRVIVQANVAKEVGTRDIVIDPLFPAGSIIDMPEGTDQSKGDALEVLDDGRDEQQCENEQLPEDVAEGENATQPKKVLLKFVKGAEEMIKDLKRQIVNSATFKIKAKNCFYVPVSCLRSLHC